MHTFVTMETAISSQASPGPSSFARLRFEFPVSSSWAVPCWGYIKNDQFYIINPY